MNSNHYCVILAGGAGKDFWPAGRESQPLQFLTIPGAGKSFLRAAYDRFAKLIPKDNIIIVTLGNYKDIVLEQIPEIYPANILIEPYSRETAFCVAYSTYEITRRNPDAVIAISPSDLLIHDEAKFQDEMVKVLDYAMKEDVIMTMGITPDHADINYGYIQVKKNSDDQKDSPMKVKTFTEKPDAELAEVFIQSGEFYWNSGIYAWKAKVILEEMEQYVREVTSLFRGWEQALGSPYQTEFIEKVYMNAERVSLSYAVMEKTTRAMLYPASFGWADIGNWMSLFDAFPTKDAKGNAINSEYSVCEDTEDCLLITKNTGKMIAIKGLKNYMVIDADDALLICPKDEKSFKDVISAMAMPKFDKFK